MRLRVLGCSGGIGGHLRTTSFLLDRDVLVDAGTGVGDLSLEELAGIDHVFLTHSHLDHVASIPFLVDSVGSLRGRPLTVYAIPETLAILQEHVFNWKVWPDFTEIPNRSTPYLRFEPLALGRTVDLNGRRITPLPANHTVPAVGFWLDSGRASLVFSGDTTSCDALWQAVNAIANLRYLIVETAFPDKERKLAVASKHLCPSLLALELAKLKSRPELFITHLKPGEIELTMREVEDLNCVICIGQEGGAEATRRETADRSVALRPRMLFNDQVFDF